MRRENLTLQNERDQASSQVKLEAEVLMRSFGLSTSSPPEAPDSDGDNPDRERREERSRKRLLVDQCQTAKEGGEQGEEHQLTYSRVHVPDLHAAQTTTPASMAGARKPV